MWPSGKRATVHQDRFQAHSTLENRLYDDLSDFMALCCVTCVTVSVPQMISFIIFQKLVSLFVFLYQNIDKSSA